MDDLFESEFNDIVRRFRKELKERNLKVSFSITGTPLRNSQVLIVGNNWGGNENSESQLKMPLVNDILVEQTNQTYRGYLNFFVNLFDGNKLKALDFLNKVVYTNGNFIRTPSEKKQYNKILDVGYEITNKYLNEIISLINCELIICFGNSDRSGTSAIFKSVGIEEDFWKIDGIISCSTINNWSTYYYSLSKNNTPLKIFSFPHSSKLHTWNKKLELNENYITLQRLLKN